MGEFIRERVKEEGKIIYRCRKDGTILWEELDNSIAIKGAECSHYEWTPVGNGCYPFPMDKEICEGTEEIAKRRVKKIDQGATIWFLIPRQ